MVENSIFPEEEIEKEKQVVLQELEMYVDNPSSHVFELSQKEVFAEGSGLHIPIIGTRESVKGITREDLVKYYDKYYKNNIKLTVGGVQTEAKNRVYLQEKFDIENRLYNAEDKIVTRKGITQAHMVVTGSFFLNTLKEQYMLKVFSAIMNGFSGRFFDVIREKNNLVYHTAFYNQIHSCGTVQYWGYAGLTPDKVPFAKNLIEEQLINVITQDELDFSKKKLIGQCKLSLDDKVDITWILIDSIMRGLDYNSLLNNYETMINSVTLQDINTFAKKLIEKQPKLVALIPEK
jgi:predicted Zn-dependent peptidase